MFVKNFFVKALYGLAAGVLYAVAVGFEHAGTVPFLGDPGSIPAQVYGPVVIALTTAAAATIKRAVAWLSGRAK